MSIPRTYTSNDLLTVVVIILVMVAAVSFLNTHPIGARPISFEQGANQYSAD